MESLGSLTPGAWRGATSRIFGAVGVRLSILGLVSLALYAFGLTARYPLRASLEDPRSTWVTFVDAPASAFALHLATYISLTVVYVLACQLLWRTRVPATRTACTVADSKPHGRMILVIVAIWLLASLILLGVAPGGESHDSFDYLFRSRMWVEYGGNPLAEVPRQYNTTPYYKYVAWHRHVDTYGPIWEAVSGGVAILVRFWLQATGTWHAALPGCPASAASCQVLVAYVTSYRLLAIALAGLCGGFIYALVRRHRPDEASVALLVWLWNPLLLIASAVGSHNDLLMLLLSLGAFWFFQRRFWLAGLLMLIAATHVKVTVLILAPVVGLWLVRQIGWQRVLRQMGALIVIALPLSWLLYAPFGGWATLPRMLQERALFVANSPFDLLHELLYGQLNWPYALVWNLTIFYPPLLFAVVALLYLLARFRFYKYPLAILSSFDDSALWSTSAIVTLLFLVLGSFWFQHWYILWLLLPCTLLPSSSYSRLALPWLCLGALASNLLSGFLPHLPGWSGDQLRLSAYIVVTIWLPALVAWSYLRWKQLS